MVCDVRDDCPNGYRRAEVVEIAKECRIPIARPAPLKGSKTMKDLCEEIRAARVPTPASAPAAPALHQNCVINSECPKGTLRTRLVQIARDCNVPVQRAAPLKGPKNLKELCEGIKRVAVIREEGFTDNNETFGQSVEYLICNIADVPADVEQHRVNADIVGDANLRAILVEALAKLPAVLRHSAANKSEVDFLLENNQTLSVKTNISKTNKVCPQVIGQASIVRFLERFGPLVNYSVAVAPSASPDDQTNLRIVKTIALKHVGFLINQYLNHMVSCDYLLWIRYTKKEKVAMILKKADIRRKFLDASKITFSKPTLAEWNESNTVYYDGVNIGEFQVHTRRAVIKFRFTMTNLLAVLNDLNKIIVLSFDPREGLREKVPSARNAASRSRSRSNLAKRIKSA